MFFGFILLLVFYCGAKLFISLDDKLTLIVISGIISYVIGYYLEKVNDLRED